MNNETLFNCQPDFREPDWSEYIALEVSPVAVFEDPMFPGESYCEAEYDIDAPWSFHSVYARLKEGGVDLITDIQKGMAVLPVLNAIAARSGLPVGFVLIRDDDDNQNQ